MMLSSQFTSSQQNVFVWSRRIHIIFTARYVIGMYAGNGNTTLRCPILDISAYDRVWFGLSIDQPNSFGSVSLPESNG